MLEFYLSEGIVKLMWAYTFCYVGIFHCFLVCLSLVYLWTGRQVGSYCPWYAAAVDAVGDDDDVNVAVVAGDAAVVDDVAGDTFVVKLMLLISVDATDVW